MSVKNRFPYLDRGYVELLDFMGSDRSVAEAAWVSSDRASERTNDDVVRIVRYLARNKHWTPFGQTAIKLRFRVPIFVARQLMRSNIGIVWNEESRRYVDSTPEFHTPTDWRRRSSSMKQGSGGVFDERLDCRSVEAFNVLFMDAHNFTPSMAVSEVYRVCISLYAKMIEAGIAPEQARIVLPLSTYTTIVGTFNIASLARVYGLRSHPHAQSEIRDLAKCIDSCVRATKAFAFSWDELKGGES
jgi:thymidylate synthase (FAD)